MPHRRPTSDLRVLTVEIVTRCATLPPGEVPEAWRQRARLGGGEAAGPAVDGRERRPPDLAWTKGGP
jgi:hypothetical protein